MVKPVLVSETPITMSDLRQELGKIKERDGELNFRANKTEDYLNQFSDFQKGQEEVAKKIEGLDISRLKPEQIAKIVDLAPKTIEELKVILQGYVLTLTQDQLKKIIEEIN